MAVQIRYRPHELGEAGHTEVINDADYIEVLDDNTVVLHNNRGKKDYIIGYVHAARWESAIVVDQADV